MLPKKDTKNDSQMALELWVPFRMWMIADKVGRHIHNFYSEKFGISRAAWRALLVLENHALISAGELAERSGMDPTRVSQAMKELEKRRMVSRKPNSKDRRQIVLQLTATGRKVYQQIEPCAREAEEDLLGSLTKEEAETLRVILEKMESSANRCFGGKLPSDLALK